MIAIELLCGAEGLDFAKAINTSALMKAGKGTEAAYGFIRRHLSFLDEDRVLYDDIQKSLSLVDGDQLLRAVEKEIGKLL